MLEQYGSLIGQVRSAWRFRWRGLLLAWLVAIIGWVVVFVIPSQFESTARIYVDTNSLLRPLLDGIAVNQSTSSTVDLVRKAMLSRPQLERVIDETDLKVRVKSSRDRENMLKDLSIGIQIVADPTKSASADPNVFNISYLDSNPALAYDVVNSVLKSFVAQSVSESRSDADVAKGFLRDQISEYESRLTEAEKRLAAFKKKNVGAMPDESGDYFAKLQTAMSTLDGLQAQLTVAKRKRDELRTKLVGGTQPSQADASLSVETSVDARIAEAQTSLEQLLLKYTDAHPDVIALRETIGRLEQQRKVELAALRQNTGLLGAPRGSTSLVVQNLQVALNQADLDVTSLESQVQATSQQVAALQSKVNVLPEVEAELSRLNRDYDVTKSEYEKLLQRREAANLSDAVDRVDELKFRVLDPPVKAIIPSKPRRALLLLGVLVVALGAGAVWAWWMSQLKPVFAHPHDLKQFEKIPILGVVMELPSTERQVQHRRDLIWFAVATAGLAVISVTMILMATSLEQVRQAMFA